MFFVTGKAVATMAKEFKLTSIRLAELEKELRYLKTTREQEVAEHLKEARSFGDLSENSEYDEAKNEQALLYARVAEVENILAHAVVIDDEEGNSSDLTGHVGLGCTVKVRDLETDETEVYAIVGSQEADPTQGMISDDSPFGRAMLGKVIGETVDVEAPMGMLRFEILSVERSA